jgi:uncharacterized membrane protein
MHTSKLTARILVAGALAAAASSLANAAPTTRHEHKEAGSCGEYMYWHDGQCVDARERAGKAWAEGMTSRPAW